MKTIVFFHQSSELYGSDKVLLNISVGLSKQSFRAIVVLPNKGPLSELLIQQGIEVIFLPILKVSRATFSVSGLLSLPFHLIYSLYSTSKALKGKRIDVVYTNTVAVLSGAIFSKMMRLPHIWHVHEVLLKPVIVRKLFPRLVNIFSDKVVSISASTTNWLTTEVGSLNKKIITVWNGIPTLDIDHKPTPEEVNELVTITLVGRINAWKGHHLLVEAAEQLVHRGITKIQILIVGSVFKDQHYFLENLKRHITEAGLQSYFKFIDFTEDINSIWSISDIAVVPSTEPEPFGMVAIEAMNNKKPVVAANHGGLSEIVVHDSTGILFEPRNSADLANSLAMLVENAETRSRMGENGKKRQMDFFSVESQVNKIATIVSDLVGS